jgi:predicted DsbA family dithiol-disulfide isomerase
LKPWALAGLRSGFASQRRVLSFPIGQRENEMPAPGSKNLLPIDMVSDVVCPWCFIGKRRLEKAIALRPEIPVAVRYRPYFLNPWVPRAGMSRAEYLTAKFGSVERYRANAERMVDAARDEGLVYNVDAITRQPNTLDCHRLIHWADEGGNAARMKQRLMDLYFTEGADLTDNEVLVAAAGDCGMDTDLTRRRLSGDEDIAVVTADAEAARSAGIEGVPCFILGGMFAVSGAQAPQLLAETIERAAAARESEEAAAAALGAI